MKKLTKTQRKRVRSELKKRKLKGRLRRIKKKKLWWEG